MKFNIDAHKLIGGRVNYSPSPNHSGKFKTGRPDAIVIHYTAGASFQSSVDSLCNKQFKASAHLVIGRKGELAQLVPFNTIAWHAGKSSLNGRKGYNHYAIGIELDNAGLLQKRGNEYYSWFGRKYPEHEVIQAVHQNDSIQKHWHDYPELQINTLEDICRILIDQYGITEIVGHDEISPFRKTDPGPAFPMDQFRQKLLGPFRNEDGEDDQAKAIIASTLNVRNKGSMKGELMGSPLNKGAKVEILEEKDGWLRVKFDQEGWVYGKYVDRG